MDVDPTNTSGGNIQDDDDDYNIDEEDILGTRSSSWVIIICLDSLD